MQTTSVLLRRFGAVALFALILGGSQALADEYVAGRATVIDGQHVTIAGKTVSLYGIEAPGPDAKCFEWRGTAQISYPCGQHAKAFLASMAAARDFVCVSAEGGASGQVTCYSDGQDVAQALVESGWAVACGYASRYVPGGTAARTARVGLWAGNFTAVGQCASGN
jgi:endonuclease YncB( thermonuclease family)